jgi:lipoprotein-releasing system permease protein
MRFELFVAARYLRAKRRQAVIGVITWISIAGVAVGVASLILALAITNGTRRDLQDRLLSSTSHVDLMRTMSDGIRDWRPLVDRLRRLPHVVAAAPGLYEPVLISRNGARAGGAMLKGIIPGEERTVSDMLADLKAGSVAPLSEAANSEDRYGSPTPPIVIGTDLADSIGASLNDVVMVTSPQGDLTPYGVVPKYQRFRVVGIFHSGFYQYDSSFGFIRLSDAQKLFRALKLEQIVTFIVIGLIVCVAALNILIALTMMVMEKTKDIAVLLSMGVQPGQIRRIFLFQGLLISVIGTIIGLVVGYLLAWAGGHYRFIHLSADVYSLDYLPFAPRILHGVIVTALSLGVSLLATLYPSSSAARVLPAEALRYE